MLEYGQKVKVIKRAENGVWGEIHHGQVVGLSTAFAKVFRAKRKDEDEAGDVSPESAEWFAIDSPQIKVECTSPVKN